MNGKILEAKVIAVHWNETDYATNELTLEVERPDGTRYMFVVPVDRMTDALPPRGEIRRSMGRSGDGGEKLQPGGESKS